MKKTDIENKNAIKTKIEQFLSETAEVRFVHRLQIIYYLIQHEDASCITAGELFNVSPRAILNWLKKINETGDLESLRDQPGKGRKTRLTAQQISQIKKALRVKPQKVGLESDKWDGKTLALYINQQMRIPMQGRQCQRLLLKLGFSNKRGRPAKV
jgi:transposase